MTMRQKALAAMCLVHRRCDTVKVRRALASAGGSTAYQRHVPVIAEEHPQLHQGQGPDPGDCEEADPFDADRDAQAKAGHDEPEPPGGLESLGRPLLMLIGEAGKGENGQGGGKNQG